jgi:hypothetical protein
MQKESIEYYTNVNPLVGLSAKTLRLYNALDILRGKSDAIEKPEWFRMPNRDHILGKIGFSKAEIDAGISELIAAKLLQIQQKNNDQWYCLK